MSRKNSFFYKDYYEHGIEDFGSVSIGFSGKSIANIVAGRLPYKIAAPIFRIHITGEKGFVSNVGTQPCLEVMGNNNRQISLGKQPLRVMAEEFLRDIEENNNVSQKGEFRKQFSQIHILNLIAQSTVLGKRYFLEGTYE